MIRVEDVLKIVNGKIICVVDDRRKVFSSKEELLNDTVYKGYAIVPISSENEAIVFELQPWQSPLTDCDAEWVKKHKEETGFEPSFF